MERTKRGETHTLYEQLTCQEMKKTEQSLEDSIHSAMIEDPEQLSKAHQTLTKFRYLRDNLEALCSIEGECEISSLRWKGIL